jgi:hypothetical protein
MTERPGKDPRKDIDAVFAEGVEIDRALQGAVREAIRRHKLLGNPIATWRDGEVVWIEPDEIDIPEDDE